MSKTIYLNFHNNFFDNIIINKRKEIYKVIYNNLNFKNIKSVLDVGATEDNKYKSSNYLATWQPNYAAQRINYRALRRGSKRSRNASPKRLNPNTARVMARPGKMGTQGALSANSSAPPCSINPQAAVGS